VVAPLTQVGFGDLEGEGVQSQYRHSSVTLAMEFL
jgi:hypothetical protein